MHSPDIKGMSRTVAAVPDSHKLSSTPVADHVLSRSPVFSRTNTSAVVTLLFYSSLGSPFCL